MSNELIVRNGLIVSGPSSLSGSLVVTGSIFSDKIAQLTSSWAVTASHALSYSGTSGTSGTAGSSGTSGTSGSSGTSGTSGSSGTSGTSGSSGSSGSSGTAGTSGQNGYSANLFNYKAKTTSNSGDPGNGYIIWNNAVQTSSAQINIDHITDDTVDIDVILGLVQVGQNLVIQDRNNSNNYQIWKVSGTPSTVANNYWMYPVTFVSSAGTGTTGFGNNTSIVLFIPSYSGTSGTSGNNGSSGTSGQNGSSGTSGTSGSSGTGGSSGSSGTSGTSGSSGTSGLSGSSGSSGTSGAGTITNGITNYVSRFLNATTLGTSSIIDNGISSIITGSLLGTSSYSISSSYAVTSVTVKDPPAPSSPINGQLWWDSSVGQLRVYYVDTDSGQWVDAVQSPLGLINNIASSSYSTTSSYSLNSAATLGLENSTQTTTYTLDINDAGRIVSMNAGSSVNVVIPANGSVPFQIGTLVGIYNQSSFALNVVTGSGVVIRNNASSVSQYQEVRLRKRATDEWVRVTWS